MFTTLLEVTWTAMDDLQRILCFCVVSTRIKTAIGFKSLSEIYQNDLVFMQRLDESEYSYKKVIDVFSRFEQEFIVFMVSNYPGYDTFEVTMDSDIYTIERGWIKAADLKHGEHLKNEKGYHIKVESVGKMYAHQPVNVCALKLEGNSFYSVSKSGILLPSITEKNSTKDCAHIGVLRERGPVLGSNSFTFSTGACGGNPFTDQKDENS